MKINIKATGITLTPAISEYIHKKIVVIEKYLTKENTETMVQMEVGKSTHHHKSGPVFRAEIRLVSGNIDLYAVSEQEDLYAAIDIVKDEIVHSLTHEKGKRQTLARRGAEMLKSIIKGLGYNRFSR